MKLQCKYWSVLVEFLCSFLIRLYLTSKIYYKASCKQRSLESLPCALLPTPTVQFLTHHPVKPQLSRCWVVGTLTPGPHWEPFRHQVSALGGVWPPTCFALLLCPIKDTVRIRPNTLHFSRNSVDSRQGHPSPQVLGVPVPSPPPCHALVCLTACNRIQVKYPNLEEENKKQDLESSRKGMLLTCWN